MVGVIFVLAIVYIFVGSVASLFYLWLNMFCELYRWMGGGMWVAYLVLAVASVHERGSVAGAVACLVGSAVWVWQWRMDRDDDDDRWRRLRKKVSGKVSVVDGRLVVQMVRA